MNIKFKQKLAYASLCVGTAALMSSSSVVHAAAPFQATQPFSLAVAAPVVVPTIVTGMSFGTTYAAIVGNHTGSASTIVSTAGALTPTVGAAPGIRLIAVSTTGKSALSYTATGGAPSAVMNLTLDDGNGPVGSQPVVSLVNGPLANGYFTLDAFSNLPTVGTVVGWSPITGTGVATLSHGGTLSAKFGATLTMVDTGLATFLDGAYAGNIRITLDY